MDGTTAAERLRAREGTRAAIDYLADPGGDTALYPSRPGAAESRYGGNRARHEVAIANARRDAGAFSLDVQGFVLVDRPTAVRDFLDEKERAAAYEAEVARLVREATGAAETLVFDHTLRASSPDVRAEKGMRDPAGTVHNDYTERSGPRRLRDLLPAEEAEARLARRFAIVNVWRPIAGPALAGDEVARRDALRVAEGERRAQHRARDRIGEIYQATWNPAHRWHFFPGMERREAILLKTYDSDPARARFTIHTAFEDPDTPPDAPPRESIESRVFAFF